MKTPKSLFGILAIATALLALCSTTAKGVTSRIYEYGSVDFNMGTNSGMTGSISIPQFNPALGVLDSVEIYAECGYSSTVTVSGPDGASGQVEASGSITVQDTGNYIYLFQNLYGAWEGNYFLPSDAGSSGADVGYTLNPPTFNNPGVLSEFTGGGNFSFQITGSQSAYLFGPGSVSIDSATITADVDVTYTYTVPEPGPFSLLAVGFGVMLIRRTTRKLFKR